jgi:hypothetical protein
MLFLGTRNTNPISICNFEPQFLFILLLEILVFFSVKALGRCSTLNQSFSIDWKIDDGWMDLSPN